MQAAVLERIAEVLPQLKPAALEREETELRKERVAAQQVGGGSATTAAAEPRTAESTIGRNDMVTITNGTETQVLKYKKAESLLASGWTVVK
jgi:hypothetical protein